MTPPTVNVNSKVKHLSGHLWWGGYANGLSGMKSDSKIDSATQNLGGDNKVLSQDNAYIVPMLYSELSDPDKQKLVSR